MPVTPGYTGNSCGHGQLNAHASDFIRTQLIYATKPKLGNKSDPQINNTYFDLFYGKFIS